MHSPTISLLRGALFGAVLMTTAQLWAIAPAGGFLVHLNQQNVSGFSDSRRSVTFYAADDLGGGPLFSVHIPGEVISPGTYNGEELDAVATDPLTGGRIRAVV